MPTLYVSDHKQRSYLEFKVATSCVMSAIAFERLLAWTNHTRISVAHRVTALIFYNITRCYGKHVAVFAVAVAAGDIIKYQSYVYGSFVWGIHVRYNNFRYLASIGDVVRRWSFIIICQLYQYCTNTILASTIIILPRINVLLLYIVTLWAKTHTWLL